MRDLYNAKLARLSDEIMEMGNLCGQAIMKTCQLLASVEIRETAQRKLEKLRKKLMIKSIMLKHFVCSCF